MLHIVKAYLSNLPKPRILEFLQRAEEELSLTPHMSKISQPTAIEPKPITKDISPTKLSIRNLEAWFGTKRALKGINLEIKEKAVTAFIGPSGCGKTTLIRCSIECMR